MKRILITTMGAMLVAPAFAASKTPNPITPPTVFPGDYGLASTNWVEEHVAPVYEEAGRLEIEKADRTDLVPVSGMEARNMPLAVVDPADGQYRPLEQTLDQTMQHIGEQVTISSIPRPNEADCSAPGGCALMFANGEYSWEPIIRGSAEPSPNSPSGAQ